MSDSGRRPGPKARARRMLPRRVRRVWRRTYRRGRRLLAATPLVRPPGPAGWDPARLSVPPPTGWTASLREAGWLDGDTLVLRGWAYVAGQRSAAVPPLISAVDPATGERRPVRTEGAPLPDVDVVAKETHRSLRGSSFVATVDLRGARPGSTWRLWAEAGPASGPLGQRLTHGTPGTLGASRRGRRVIAPEWSTEHGLELVVTRADRRSGRRDRSAPDRPAVLVDSADVDADGSLRLRLGAVAAGSYRLELSGRRARPDVTARLGADPVPVVLPLVTAGVSLPSDRYAVQVYAEGAEQPLPLRLGPSLSAPAEPTEPTVSTPLGRWVFRPWFRARFEWTEDQTLRLLVARPADPDAWGPYFDQRARAADRQCPDEPADLVYFESFNGRRAACNPLAIRQVVARTRPELRRVWAIEDQAVVTPGDDERVVIGSPEWQRARRTARWLVTNDWLRDYTPRPFQYFLQTWHGTPLKKLALDRPGRGEKPGFAASVARQTAGWDALVSQSAYMTETMRGAYGYDGPVLEIGYPRNDVIAWQAGRRAELRAELGIAADRTAVLYAPTWREDGQNKLVRFLDPAELSRRLGPEFTLLVRGHVANIPRDTQVQHGAVDVTLYPQVEDLFVAADVLITDYSSVMFDFAVTGKPMVFFVPDLADYCSTARGVYFDLAALAPGPLVADLDALVPALTASNDRAGWDRSWGERYRDWQQRFVPRDDGHAAERAVAAMFSADAAPGPGATSGADPAPGGARRG